MPKRLTYLSNVWPTGSSCRQGLIDHVDHLLHLFSYACWGCLPIAVNLEACWCAGSRM